MTSSLRKELKVELLLARASPRANIPKVEIHNLSLPCDMIIPRFVGEWNAYQLLRDYFLSHKQYTHLVLATDDIVVLPEHVEQLQKDLELNDYPVLSGMMNVNQTDTSDMNISVKGLASKTDRLNRVYNWLTRDEIKPYNDIFEVTFSGFPLMAISRDIIERYEFMADFVFLDGPAYVGDSLDLVFCWWCKMNDIPIHVDKRIDMVHLRQSGEMRTHLPNELWFWDKDESEPVRLL